MNPKTTTCRDALLVLLADPGTQPLDALRRARDHGTRCPRCASVLDDHASATAIVEAVRRGRPRIPTVLRITLVVLATVQLVVAIPWLFGASLVPDRNVATEHLTRDGALGILVAAAGYLVAWRPRYALAATLVGTTALVLQFATGFVDNRDHDVSMTFELTHLLVFAILAVLAIVSSTARGQTPDASPPRASLHSL